MNASAEPLPLPEDLAEGDAPVKDRMTTTLFLAALFHGIVILGITFAAPSLRQPSTPTLEVLLLTHEDTRAADNPNAQYLAQRSQQGAGTTEERVRPANPASSLLTARQAGEADGNGSEYQQAVDGERASELLTSRDAGSEVLPRSGETRPARDAQTPLALAATPPSPIATNTPDETLRLRGRRPDGQVDIVPNTRESAVAPYLDAWRRKVERLGTLNFPEALRHTPHTGNPVLEVALRADGSLGEVVVRRSSGRKEFDQAALSILRLASPFDPFPAELRQQYEELRFAYEWQFLAQ
ncbi:MAG: hypothetical protein DIU71_04995 [Proteobacteria bacterium]|nr:MAG: hypothetical protein DIU71_04995 [Pseudomonadota bacterium]